METVSKTTITVKTVVDAPIEKIWEIWTTPQHITQWNNASPDWHCPKAENNLTVGNKFVYTMASKDGAMSFDFSGIYSEIIPLSKIAYAMEDGRKVIITFEQSGEKIIVTESFDPETIHPHDVQQKGWQSILNNFKAYLEQ